MITNIRETEDSGIVTADGPLFDMEKVLDTGFRMVQVLVNRARMAYPEMVPEVKLIGSDPVVLQDHHFDILRLYCNQELAIYDVGTFDIVFILHPFYLRFSPFGIDVLRRVGDGYETDTGAPMEEIDITPRLYISGNTTSRIIVDRSAERLLRDIFTDRDPELTEFPQSERDDELVLETEGSFILESAMEKLAHSALGSFGDEGIEFVKSGPYMVVEFPHTTFGKGFGRVRIECYGD